MSKKKYKKYYIGISILVFLILATPRLIGYIKQVALNPVVKEAYSEDSLNFKTNQMLSIGPVPEFSLINQHHERISNQDLLGKVYVVEFFFSTCPTICPRMQESLVEIQNTYLENPNIAFVSISINPEHDTPEVLKAYAESNNVVNANWHFLTGDLDYIYDIANKGFNLYTAEAPEVEGGFEHSGYFALIDKEGNISSRIDKYGNPKFYYNGLEESDVKKLIQDIKKLL